MNPWVDPFNWLLVGLIVCGAALVIAGWRGRR